MSNRNGKKQVVSNNLIYITLSQNQSLEKFGKAKKQKTKHLNYYYYLYKFLKWQD